MSAPIAVVDLFDPEPGDRLLDGERGLATVVAFVRLAGRGLVVVRWDEGRPGARLDVLPYVTIEPDPVMDGCWLA